MDTTGATGEAMNTAALQVEVDWTASKESWIEEARAAWAPRLLKNARFPDGRKLLKRFDHEVEVWRANRDSGFTFRQVINFGNEVAAAVGLLDHVKDLETLRYEPKMPGVAKSLDFLLHNARGDRAWVDVKTIAPQWIDGEREWQRFLSIQHNFPANTHFGVKRKFGGAAIASQSIKTRWTFVTRTLEVEEKAALIPESLRGPVTVLFCSNRFAWYPDDLEDFADLYRTGRFREDDWSRNEVLRYMREEKNKTFARTLAGFHYLGRRDDEVSVDLRFRVRGPRFFAP
jgi:hypothetical protein